jgi:hypothetical protein
MRKLFFCILFYYNMEVLGLLTQQQSKLIPISIKSIKIDIMYLWFNLFCCLSAVCFGRMDYHQMVCLMKQTVIEL